MGSTERPEEGDFGTIKRAFIKRGAVLSWFLEGGWDIHKQIMKKHDP